MTKIIHLEKQITALKRERNALQRSLKAEQRAHQKTREIAESNRLAYVDACRGLNDEIFTLQAKRPRSIWEWFKMLMGML
jgi:predicted  nucleic acid-binding Zn-ribbon protein